MSPAEVRALEGIESARVGLTEEEREAIAQQKVELEKLLETYKKEPAKNSEKIKMVEAQIRELTAPKGRGRRRGHRTRKVNRRRKY